MRRVSAGEALLALVVLLSAAGCRRPAEPRTPADREAAQASAIATVFETPEPYSSRRIDSLDLPAFLARHPEYRADSAQVAQFYARREMQFAWIVGDSLSAGADAFIALAGVVDSGTPALGDFGHRLAELHDDAVAGSGATALCDSCATETELRLTAEFFRLAARRYGGVVRRDLRELNWYIPRAKKDLARLMDSLATGTMDLAAFEPVHPQYGLLRAGMPRLHAIAREPWPAIALPRGRRSIEPGDSADVVRDVRRRLHLLGDIATDDGAVVHDASLAAAVGRFQQRHGLTADGIVGAATLRAMNVPPSERLRTMLVNIERLRWMPEQTPPGALVVNIPEFRLHVYEDHREVMSMRIVVGAHATRTVVFTSTLTSMVLSPSWTVPWSITRKEILPAVRRDPEYLRKNEMEIVGGTAARPVIRQKPGASNPLGRVKFVFPNGFDIFMHDTPAQALFERDARAFSHGCIRLDEPKPLAEYLLRDAPEWSPERLEAVMLGEVETTVRVPTPRPVLVVYFTAWVDDEGRLNFRDDIYGHDRRLAAELFR